ncbi:20028_t:CDS:2 [Rhizophagus irregularis]|nr:20028_t:CDS:2 [Rhizophagus irregularis]
MKAIYDSAMQDDLGLGLQVMNSYVKMDKGNVEGSKSKGKEIETDNDKLNENNKRIQGSREDNDSE